MLLGCILFDCLLDSAKNPDEAELDEALQNVVSLRYSDLLYK